MTDPPRNFRLKGIVACDALLRILRLASDIFGPDLDRIVVYLSVVSAAGSHYQRNPELRARYADAEPLPAEKLLGISRRAIADSVGLPRETVRRKIAALIAAGYIVEEGGLVKPRTPIVELGRNMEFLQGLLKELDRVGVDLKSADEA